jgi:hypothetical protein
MPYGKEMARRSRSALALVELRVVIADHHRVGGAGASGRADGEQVGPTTTKRQ